MSSRRPLTVEEIHWIHERVVDTYDLVHDGTVHPNPDVVIGDILETAADVQDPHRQAAFVMYRIVTTHVYADGNKRTAWLASVRILSDEDERAAPDRDEVPTVLRHVSRYRPAELARWFRTGDVDRSRLRTQE